jgi:hypothetical protein
MCGNATSCHPADTECCEHQFAQMRECWCRQDDVAMLERCLKKLRDEVQWVEQRIGELKKKTT